MYSAAQDKHLSNSHNQLLNSLVRELKGPLVLIARRAELEKSGGKLNDALQSIQDTADKTLQLIDSYLLTTQSEYGQHSLQLEPMGIGSIVYELAQDLRSYAKDKKIDLMVDVKDGDVMGNREGLKAVILCLSELAMVQNSDQRNVRRKKILIQTKKEKETVSVSILSNQMDISNKDIDLARQMQGNAHLAGGRVLDSGIRLAIADILTGALGSSLQTRQSNGLKGLNFELVRSKQLQLV